MNTSTRYNCIGRKVAISPKLLDGKMGMLRTHRLREEQRNAPEYASPYDWHDPVNFCLGGPTIPADVSPRQLSDIDRVEGLSLTANPLARRMNQRSELGFASQVCLFHHFCRPAKEEHETLRVSYVTKD